MVGRIFEARIQSEARTVSVLLRMNYLQTKVEGRSRVDATSIVDIETDDQTLFILQGSSFCVQKQGFVKIGVFARQTCSPESAYLLAADEVESENSRNNACSGSLLPTCESDQH